MGEVVFIGERIGKSGSGNSTLSSGGSSGGGDK